MKKKVLFIADKPNWAYEFMVQSWIPFLSKEYECFIAYQDDYFIKKNNHNNLFRFYIYNFLNNIRFFFYKLLKKEKRVYFISKNLKYYYPKYTFDKVYQFSPHLEKKATPNQTKFDIQVEMAYYFQYAAEFPFKASKKIVGIFTDIFPHEGPEMDMKINQLRTELSRGDFYKKYLQKYDHIIVGGGNLYSEYQKFTDKISFVYGIFGQEHFIENPHVGKNEYLTIGWTGTPDRPMKGFRTIIEPAIENVKKTGRKIHLKTKFSGPYTDLYSFYKDVDVVIIASNADSGPSMYAEACLSSVPSISTKVGLPLSFLKDGINGVFIERTIEDLEKKIIDLYDNREKLIMFSQIVKSDYLEVMDNKITVEYVKKILYK